MAPSAQETQLSNESLIGARPAPSAMFNTVASLSLQDDTPHADEYQDTDENIGMDNLNMDGNYSQDEHLSEDENLGADGNPNEDDIDADELESDNNSDVDENSGADDNSSADGNSSADSSIESLADNTLEHDTDHKISKRCRRLLEDIENVRQGVLKADVATKNLKRKAESAESEAAICKRYISEVRKKSTPFERAMEDMRAECKELKTANAKLRRELIEVARETDDRDSINEANKHLRLDLDKTKAQLRKELDEKADYHNIKKERTEFHLKLIKKTNECVDLEKMNAKLQLKLDEEASFSAQVMAMFSKEPKI